MSLLLGRKSSVVAADETAATAAAGAAAATSSVAGTPVTGAQSARPTTAMPVIAVTDAADDDDGEGDDGPAGISPAGGSSTTRRRRNHAKTLKLTVVAKAAHELTDKDIHTERKQMRRGLAFVDGIMVASAEGSGTSARKDGVTDRSAGPVTYTGRLDLVAATLAPNSVGALRRKIAAERAEAAVAAGIVPVAQTPPAPAVPLTSPVLAASPAAAATMSPPLAVTPTPIASPAAVVQLASPTPAAASGVAVAGSADPPDVDATGRLTPPPASPGGAGDDGDDPSATRRSRGTSDGGSAQASELDATPRRSSSSSASDGVDAADSTGDLLDRTSSSADALTGTSRGKRDSDPSEGDAGGFEVQTPAAEATLATKSATGIAGSTVAAHPGADSVADPTDDRNGMPPHEAFSVPWSYQAWLVPIGGLLIIGAAWGPTLWLVLPLLLSGVTTPSSASEMTSAAGLADGGPWFTLAALGRSVTPAAVVFGYAAIIADVFAAVIALGVAGLPFFAACNPCKRVAAPATHGLADAPTGSRRSRRPPATSLEVASITHPSYNDIIEGLRQGLSVHPSARWEPSLVPFPAIRAVGAGTRSDVAAVAVLVVLWACPLATLAWATEVPCPRPVSVILAVIALLRVLMTPASALAALALLRTSLRVTWRVTVDCCCKRRPTKRTRKVAPAGSPSKSPRRPPIPAEVWEPITPDERLAHQMRDAPVAACFGWRARRVAFLSCLVGTLAAVVLTATLILVLMSGTAATSNVSSTPSAERTTTVVRLFSSPWFILAITVLPLGSALFGFVHGACSSMPTSSLHLHLLGASSCLMVYIATPRCSETAPIGKLSVFWSCGEGRTGGRAPVVGNCVGFLTPLIDSLSTGFGCLPAASRHFRLSPYPSSEAIVFVGLPVSHAAAAALAASIRASLDPGLLAPPVPVPVAAAAVRWLDEATEPAAAVTVDKPHLATTSALRSVERSTTKPTLATPVTLVSAKAAAPPTGQAPAVPGLSLSKVRTPVVAPSSKFSV